MPTAVQGACQNGTPVPADRKRIGSNITATFSFFIALVQALRHGFVAERTFQACVDDRYGQAAFVPSAGKLDVVETNKGRAGTVGW
jgi:hypothetical protein